MRDEYDLQVRQSPVHGDEMSDEIIPASHKPQPRRPDGELDPADMSVSPVEKYREFLSVNGKRMTQEKRAVVEEIFSHHEHFDREQLIQRITQSDSIRASRATVHRILNDLEAAGMIRRVARVNDREIYELDYGYPQHDHLICEKCGCLIEFPNQSITDVLETIAADHGFRVSGHRLEVYGICNTCSRPPLRQHPKLDMI